MITCKCSDTAEYQYKPYSGSTKKILLGPKITQQSFCSMKRPKNLPVTPKRWCHMKMTAISHEVLISEVLCLF